MSNQLIETITSNDTSVRNRSIRDLLQNKDKNQLIRFAGELESFRLRSENLYHKVRASLFLFVIYRFYLQFSSEIPSHGKIPFKGIKAAFERNFEKAIDIYLTDIKGNDKLNNTICSAISDSYYKLAFKYLLDQVKLSISHCKENYHLYNINDLNDYPFSVPSHMTTADASTGRYPVGMDVAPVRLDPSHSGWSDIFFLGMDFPQGARVVNLSVDLKIHGSKEPILPPCECYCRFIEEPVIHLISIDLNSSKKVSSLQELFNFGNDYLSLLKAGVVASGIVPPCFEHSDILLKDILLKLLNKSGGIEVVTKVNGIPKGSRLAVSTTLLAAIITRLMRFSRQIEQQTGPLEEDERRVVVSRAILGEWLGGSGGGWQDSGGLWPGMKVITGRVAENGDPEFGVSTGCLLPEHNVFNKKEFSEDIEKKIIDSMVLVHGGISQDVGPILEMVTEKYLLKYAGEWTARLNSIELYDEIVKALKAGDMKELGKLTTRDWEEATQHIIPWVNNAFTSDLINRVKKEYKEQYWGFLMLGGMSGGGMAFIVDPEIREPFKSKVTRIMKELKQKYISSLPFVIDPVVYDFAINHEGIVGRILQGKEAIMPAMNSFKIKNIESTEPAQKEIGEDKIRGKYGFDISSHEHIKSLLKKGEIGLSKNRLPLSVSIEDVTEEDINHFEGKNTNSDYYNAGLDALKNNEIAIVTFAGGMGSRWTDGAAVVKAINPFISIKNKYRTFIEIHLAKSRMTGKISGHKLQHVFTTSYLTHNCIVRYMDNCNYFDYKDRLYLSNSQSIAQRVYPMERDLIFYWKEQSTQKMDENVQKVQDAQHNALIDWTKSRGEGEDYSENKPIMRFNPPGHWYEIPNLLKNGVLNNMLRDNSNLKYLLCHNIDTLGSFVDPLLFGMHIAGQSTMTFEVTPRRVEDVGGGPARVNGHLRLIEGLALPREEDEYKMSYYNTLTNWISIDALLDFFELDRKDILEAEHNAEKKKHIIEAIRRVENKIPTYVTIKNVKYLWGSGQEDVYPVTQFEKLWGDMTALKELKVSYVSVPRSRGMQLKDPSLLDMWANDGSFDYLKNIACF